MSGVRAAALDYARIFRHLGATAFLQKPFPIGDLLAVLGGTAAVPAPASAADPALSQDRDVIRVARSLVQRDGGADAARHAARRARELREEGNHEACALLDAVCDAIETMNRDRGAAFLRDRAHRAPALIAPAK
jgi:hypothetical protein